MTLTLRTATTAAVVFVLGAFTTPAAMLETEPFSDSCSPLARGLYLRPCLGGMPDRLPAIHARSLHARLIGTGLTRGGIAPGFALCFPWLEPLAAVLTAPVVVIVAVQAV